MQCQERLKTKSQSTLVLDCITCKRGFYFSVKSFLIIVNGGKAPVGFFKRLSVKSLTAASYRNSEMPNQHFVIGIRKLHPLCNNIFLSGEVPNGLLPM